MFLYFFNTYQIVQKLGHLQNGSCNFSKLTKVKVEKKNHQPYCHEIFMAFYVVWPSEICPTTYCISYYTGNVYIGSTAEVHFFCVILEKNTRIYLLSLVHKKSANNTHFMCNGIAVNMCNFYTRINAIFTSE